MLQLLVVALVVGAASAGAPSSDATPPDRRWTFTVGVGRTPGSAPGSIEQAMRDAGFDQTSSSDLVQLRYPRSSHGGLAWVMSIHYRFATRFAAGVTAFRSDEAEGSGFINRGFLGIELNLATRLRGLAPLFSLEADDWTGIVSPRLGFGPALYLVTVNATSMGDPVASRETSKLGFVVDLELRIPARTRFYGSLQGQYRYVGDVDVGPYTLTGLFQTGATFPASRITLNQWHLGVGVGMRL